jgi:4'-phosphopantetheinyl transferase EntD
MPAFCGSQMQEVPRAMLGDGSLGAPDKYMLDSILPAEIIAIEDRGGGSPPPLHPDEARFVSKAVPARQAEFARARACAHEAIRLLGLRPDAILKGPRGEPQWPPGVTGSITHCPGYCAAAATTIDHDVIAVGIDAEPHAPLPEGVLDLIATSSERARLEELGWERPSRHWDRLLFSIKESTFKAWYPLTRIWVEAERLSVKIDPVGGVFLASVKSADSSRARSVRIEGRFLIADDLVLTATVLSRKAIR